MVPPTQKIGKPNEAQIRQTIVDLQKRMKDPDMDKFINRAIKEGYKEVLNILVEGWETYEGLDKLRTVQGRDIAVLGVDYLQGSCTKKELLGVPLKQ